VNTLTAGFLSKHPNANPFSRKSKSHTLVRAVRGIFPLVQNHRAGYDSRLKPLPPTQSATQRFGRFRCSFRQKSAKMVGAFNNVAPVPDYGRIANSTVTKRSVKLKPERNKDYETAY
jgi:hypothetical protein